jgi:hypothetical protein
MGFLTSRLARAAVGVAATVPTGITVHHTTAPSTTPIVACTPLGFCTADPGSALTSPPSLVPCWVPFLCASTPTLAPPTVKPKTQEKTKPLPFPPLPPLFSPPTTRPDDCARKAATTSQSLPAQAGAEHIKANTRKTRNVASAVYCIDRKYATMIEVSGGDDPPRGLPVPNPDPRPLDAERKLLDRVAEQFPNGGTGTLYLYTLLEPCQFCKPNAIGAFRRTKEPGITLVCNHGPYTSGADLKNRYPQLGAQVSGTC